MTARATAPELGREIVQCLLDHGIRQVVAAPGSRNAPLLLALAERSSRAPRSSDDGANVVLTVRTDERGAAFWALGQAKASGEPVAVVTTSGTAVGNLLPAIMEAHHSHVPIMVVSADRPEPALDTGANQTTHQTGIFGRFVAAEADISDAGTPASRRHQIARLALAARGLSARGGSGDAGPVHLNVRFAAPLVETPGQSPGQAGVPSVPAGTFQEAPGVPAGTSGRRVMTRSVTPVELPSGPRTVVLVGDASPSVGARALERSVDHPLLAEPSSNAREVHALRLPRLLLQTGLAEEIERVVVFGHPTLSRPQQALLGRADVEVIQVGAADAVPMRTSLVCDDVVLPPGDPDWSQRWHRADDRLSARLDDLLADRWCGPSVAQAVLESTRPDAGVSANLIMGSSSPARDLDIAAVPEGVPPYFWANRGLAGIDGLIATAGGIASVRGPSTLLIGDVSFTHDLPSLLTGPHERRPDLRIVVANDHGGSIFHTLEQGADAHAAHFERVFATPLTLDLEPLAAAVGATFHRVGDLDSLRRVLARPIDGLDIIDAPIPRHDRRELDAAINALAEDVGRVGPP